MIGQLTGVSLQQRFMGRTRLTNYDVQPLRKGDLAVISTEIRPSGDADSFFKADIVKIDAVEPHRGRRVNGHKVPWWGVREEADSVDYVRVTDAAGQHPREFLLGTYVTPKGLAYRREYQATVMHAKDETGAPLRIRFKESDPAYRQHLTGENMLQVGKAPLRERVFIHRWEDYLTIHGKVLAHQAEQAQQQHQGRPEPSWYRGTPSPN